MLVALTVFVALSLPAHAGDPSDPEPPPAPLVANETAPPPPVADPAEAPAAAPIEDPSDVVRPADPAEPTPTRTPDPALATEPKKPAPSPPRPKLPEPEPVRGVAKDPTRLGLSAGLGGCLGIVVPAACAFIFPPVLVAVPCTAPVGAMAGSAIAAGFDEGAPDVAPLLITAGVAVIGSTLVGAGLGAGVGLLSCQGDSTACAYLAPGIAAVGGGIGLGVSPVIAGIAVALIASQSAHPLTPPG